MLAMFNNQPIFGPRGPAGPDGNPIGTIISYMGVSAPTDYLICDGSVYNVSDYSKLAEFFKTQFGSSNYFGGDGATTFAVPDMRNLFLRGFHGASEEQLSGEVGVKQKATEHLVINDGYQYIRAPSFPNWNGANNVDSSIGNIPSDGFARNSLDTEVTIPSHYTSRPVNMAVLYCIKATIAEPRQELYSEEEQRIGTWIDGKPLYRITIPSVTGSAINTDKNMDASFLEIGTLLDLRGLIFATDGTSTFAGSLPLVWTNAIVGLLYNKTLKTIIERHNHNFYSNAQIYIHVEYTKTTDL